MKAAVIGAGWAGLAAAYRLRRDGHSVVVYEAARTLGGRARRVHSRALDTWIDNGQHILLGAYSETQKLMEGLGLDPASLFHRERLTLESADAQFSMHAANLPAPLHLLSAIVTARGLNVKERLLMLALTSGLRRRGWKVARGLTVAQWLRQGGQTANVIRRFWHPLCLAALNTPLDEACAQLFANVLRDSLGGAKHASDVLIPAVDLSRLWPDQVETYLAADPAGASSVRRGCAARELACKANGVQVNGEHFDAAVIACNIPSARKLIGQLEPSVDGARYLATLAAFAFLPIATITLQLDRPWSLPRAMLMLSDDPARMHFGQWLFNRNALQQQRTVESDTADGAAAPSALLHVVVSDARTMQQHPGEDIAAGVVAQIIEQTSRFEPMPRVMAHSIITEKRASFAATPGLLRPSNETPWPRIWTAGDWTDTGYPAVLEGAVRSGLKAGELAGRALTSA